MNEALYGQICIYNYILRHHTAAKFVILSGDTVIYNQLSERNKDKAIFH
jgi:hypothetical protein